MILIGTHHHTEKIAINEHKLLKSSSLKTSTYQDIIIKVDNGDGVGDVQAVWISMDSKCIPLLDTSWFLEYIEVYRNSSEKNIFPCYHWIKNEHLTISSKTGR